MGDQTGDERGAGRGELAASVDYGTSGVYSLLRGVGISWRRGCQGTASRCLTGSI